MTQKLNELNQKINELKAALTKENLPEKTREAISQRLDEVESLLAAYRKLNKGEV